MRTIIDRLKRSTEALAARLGGRDDRPGRQAVMDEAESAVREAGGEA